MNQDIVDELQRTAGQRRSTLARHVLRLPSLERRRAWIADFGKRNGQLAEAQLRADMLAELDSRKAASRGGADQGIEP